MIYKHISKSIIKQFCTVSNTEQTVTSILIPVVGIFSWSSIVQYSIEPVCAIINVHLSQRYQQAHYCPFTFGKSCDLLKEMRFLLIKMWMQDLGETGSILHKTAISDLLQ